MDDYCAVQWDGVLLALISQRIVEVVFSVKHFFGALLRNSRTFPFHLSRKTLEYSQGTIFESFLYEENYSNVTYEMI